MAPPPITNATNVGQTLSPEHAELIRRCVESLETGQRQVEIAAASAEKTNASERALRDAHVAEQKADVAKRFRVQLAAGFLGEAAGILEDEAFRIEARRALRWADLLLEEASR